MLKKHLRLFILTLFILCNVSIEGQDTTPPAEWDNQLYMGNKIGGGLYSNAADNSILSRINPE